jgi:hypothetical protein
MPRSLRADFENMDAAQAAAETIAHSGVGRERIHVSAGPAPALTVVARDSELGALREMLRERGARSTRIEESG